MNVRQAASSDLETVEMIVQTTISEIYPHYYPKGAVDYFLAHHMRQKIEDDIRQNRVFLCCDAQQTVGTVAVRDNTISRLFVLPVHQGKGYGRALLDFAENMILQHADEIIIDASFPAKSIYLKRGYREINYVTIQTDGGDYLCYDIMKKEKTRSDHHE